MLKITANTPHIKGEFNLKVAKYMETMGLCLMLEDEKGYPEATLTVNLGHRVSEGYIAVKDYNENIGVADMLVINGIIEFQPVDWITSGFVKIPIYKLTEKGLSL